MVTIWGTLKVGTSKTSVTFKTNLVGMKYNIFYVILRMLGIKSKLF